MSVALTRHQTGKHAIGKALPWAGMGLCLTILIGHLAYDVLGRSHLQAAVGTPESRRDGAGDHPTRQRNHGEVDGFEIYRSQNHDRSRRDWNAW